MAFDPSIISQIPDYAGDPTAAQEKAVGLKDMVDRGQLNRLQLSQAQREAKINQDVEQILRSSDYSTPEGLAQTAAKVNRVSPDHAMKLMQFGQQYQSGKVQQERDQLELLEQRQGLIVQAIDPIVNQARQMKSQGASDLDVKAWITQQMPQALQQLRSIQLPDGKPALPDDQLQMVTGIPGGYTLATLEGWEQKSKAGHAAIQQRLEQGRADTQSRSEQERERHDQRMETISAGRAAGGRYGISEPATDQGSDLKDSFMQLTGGRVSVAQLRALNFDELAKRGMTAQQLVSSGLQYAGETRAASAVGQRAGNVAVLEGSVGGAADQVLDALGGVDRTNITSVNKALAAGKRQFGNAAESRYAAAVQSLVNEYSRVISGGTGASTDSARSEAMGMLNTAQSPDQVRAVVSQMRREVAIVKSASQRALAGQGGGADAGPGPQAFGAGAPGPGGQSQNTPPGLPSGFVLDR
jgi:hypothetical protein